MKRIVTILAAVALTLGLGTATANAGQDHARKGWDRQAQPRFAKGCATPFEVSRVKLGDSPRKVRRKITAKHHRWQRDRRVMIVRPCRYFVRDRDAVVLIRFQKSEVVVRYAHGGSFNHVR